MQIYDLRERELDENFILSVSINSRRLGIKELWFSAPAKYKDYFCRTRMDGFLVGMLFPAMQYGEDIHIKGCVSKKLLFNLNNYVVPLLLAFSPSCKIIDIVPDETSTEHFHGVGIGTGFSGGVDSFCTIYDRFERENSPEYKINNLFFLNVGSHGDNLKGHLESAQKKFFNRYTYLKRYADEIALDFLPLDSNLHAFHPWGHQKTHTLTSMAGALILQGYYSKYYYSSSGINYADMLTNANHYKELDVGAYCDPILLPLLSTESLELIPDGYQYSRIDKIRRIINYEPIYRYLNVCVSLDDTYENCSICPKCCRTLMTIGLLGKYEQFSRVFDIAKYKQKAERRYVCNQILVKNKDPFAKENIELALQNGIKLPNYISSKAYLFERRIFDNIIILLSIFCSPAFIARIKEFVKKLNFL